MRTRLFFPRNAVNAHIWCFRILLNAHANLSLLFVEHVDACVWCFRPNRRNVFRFVRLIYFGAEIWPLSRYVSKSMVGSKLFTYFTYVVFRSIFASCSSLQWKPRMSSLYTKDYTLNRTVIFSHSSWILAVTSSILGAFASIPPPLTRYCSCSGVNRRVG